jgi:hypothetical protein
MTTPSGQISLSQVNTELGLTSTATITLNDTAVRSLAGVTTTNSTIAMSNLQGKSNQFAYTITTNQSNLVLTSFLPGVGWNGTSSVALTINSGVYIWSSSTANAALTTGALSGLTITNAGYIMGCGGLGGSNLGGGQCAARKGGNGGHAISLGVNALINNTGYIAGGGGGGANECLGGGGGGAGGGAGGRYCGTAIGASGGAVAGGTGGAIGVAGNNGSQALFCGTAYAGTGGGGGRILPGTGGAGGTYVGGNSQLGGKGGGAGGGGSGFQSCGCSYPGGAGGSGSAAGGNSGCGAAGGGGWGASGGSGNNFNNSGGTGGKAIALNGFTRTGSGGTVYGAIS